MVGITCYTIARIPDWLPEVSRTPQVSHRLYGGNLESIYQVQTNNNETRKIHKGHRVRTQECRLPRFVDAVGQHGVPASSRDASNMSQNAGIILK